MPLSNDAKIDASTLLAGCGLRSPAFISWYIERLSKIGSPILSEDEIKIMMTQTMRGTTAMLETLSVAEIIKAVASPGGATEATLKTLEQNKIDHEIDYALITAQRKIESISISM